MKPELTTILKQANSVITNIKFADLAILTTDQQQTVNYYHFDPSKPENTYFTNTITLEKNEKLLSTNISNKTFNALIVAQGKNTDIKKTNKNKYNDRQENHQHLYSFNRNHKILHHNKLIAEIYPENEIKIWDEGGYFITSFKEASYTENIQFSQDHKLIITSHPRKIKIRTIKGELLQTLSPPTSEIDRQYISNTSITPDNKFITTTVDNEAQIWDIATGNLITTLKNRDASITNCQIVNTPIDNYYVVATASSEDCTVRLWDTKGILLASNPFKPTATFNKTGCLLAIATPDNTINILDTATGQMITQIETQPHQITKIAFSNDSKYLATGDTEGSVKIWQITN